MKPFLQNIVTERPGIDRFVEELGDELDYLRRYAETPQDPEWHAEGDVHIHTGMVLDEAYRLLDGPAAHLDESQARLLILGALLHDIAKPITTSRRKLHDVVRTVAKNHEAIGRSYLAPRLLEWGLSYEELDTLLGLVGYHHEPKFLAVKNKTAGAYQRLARLADPELLYWLEQADMRGRTCTDKKQQVDNIDMFRMFAEEYGAFERNGTQHESWVARLKEATEDLDSDTVDFIMAESRRSFESGDIHSVEEAIARSYNIRPPFARLVIFVGPSGSGKSTFVQRHLTNYDVVSLDDLREELGKGRDDQSVNDKVLNEARERLKVSLRKKASVVWDATSLRKDFRSRAAELGFRYGALVTQVVFHIDPDTLKRRNRDRTHAVSDATLTRQLELMEWPELDEAHRTVFVNAEHEVLGAHGFSEPPFGLSPAR